jgi:hypothetical protein
VDPAENFENTGHYCPLESNTGAEILRILACFDRLLSTFPAIREFLNHKFQIKCVCPYMGIMDF